MRRRYLWLLAVFVPTALGLAALSYLIFAPGPQSEASTTAPIVRQAPRVDESISDETVVAPTDADLIEPSAPRNDETPVTEPQSSQRPAHAEPSDTIGPPMLASSTAAQSSTDGPAPTRTRSALRLASLSAAGGGGGGAPSTNGSSKTAGDSATNPPVDTSNSGSNGSGSSTSGGSSNSSSSGTGGDTDPNGGKDGAAPNVPNPNPDGDHDDENNGNENGNDEEEDPPVSDDNPYPSDPFPHDDEHRPVQVPEPASFGLLLLGLAGFAAGRRRKK